MVGAQDDSSRLIGLNWPGVVGQLNGTNTNLTGPTNNLNLSVESSFSPSEIYVFRFRGIRLIPLLDRVEIIGANPLILVVGQNFPGVGRYPLWCWMLSSLLSAKPLFPTVETAVFGLYWVRDGNLLTGSKWSGVGVMPPAVTQESLGTSPRPDVSIKYFRPFCRLNRLFCRAKRLSPVYAWTAVYHLSDRVEIVGMVPMEPTVAWGLPKHRSKPDFGIGYRSPFIG